MKLERIEEGISDAERARRQDEVEISKILLQNCRAYKSVVRVAQERIWLEYERSMVKTEEERLTLAKEQRQKLEVALHDRRQELENAQQELTRGVQVLAECEKELQLQKEASLSAQKEIAGQRKRICEDLDKIYPIEPIVGRTFAFSIRGIELPNTSYNGYDEEQIGTALGYTAHLVYLLSFYLGVKLRYPVNPGGNRSYVEDPVSVFQGPRTFPLWPKGSVYYRFEYGVFLLNKSIEQLMNSQSLLAIDLRHTLPNLKCLLLSLESGS
ncbi:UV radiation resistance protein/autophagy-related protein 14 [Dipodascopsis uninucleata]